MPKDNIRDNLDGNDLDLSLNNLSVVPVKELSAIPKATHLDLSCNILVSLPESFCALNHVVKLDLSKNQLAALPVKFGNLSNLQHLDLLGNQLKHLPLSFSQLNKLKWLDLKDNPLDPALNKAAGDCLDESQCRKCARNVVQFMKEAHAEAERLKQKELQERREREEAAQRREEEERQRKKADKKAEKLRRKREHEARQAQDKAEIVEEHENTLEEEKWPNGIKTEESVKDGWSCIARCFIMFLTLLILVLAIGLIAHSYCDQNEKDDVCHTYYVPSRYFLVQYAHTVKAQLQEFVLYFNKMVSSYVG